MVPIAGSAYTYAYTSIGEFVAWIIGWDLIVEYAVGNIGVAIGWSGHFKELMTHFGVDHPGVAVDGLPVGARRVHRVRCRHERRRPRSISRPPGPPRRTSAACPVIFNLPAFAVVAVITVVLVIGIKESANSNNAMVLLKIGIIIFFLCVGAFLIKP